ncbi:type II toxin-antitoxin system VapC family toxin [Propionibacterium australiense]|uniref:PIN domain n=1 Tax=Propionibacterium australiense TaxID=119981 RepID=A0A383S4Z0_9ACTN|nr:type II toxin-antitoxin system VapC family toxin [Propionibacterium australiense]RLP10012.1 PIN domain-containing protein [Propionibacterium australiense]RLP11297.1 PIN domain-containing protein [Propionibacterium australiense]SYZ32923.1 PIN domain [Propionibacterium australiense]VEH92423.1 Probable ribonuclease VapC47 [Propionibacterium australiense]
MTICYLDTSAALKLLIEEAESESLGSWLTGEVTDGMTLCSSFLLHVELHCAARRRHRLDEQAVASLLAGIELIDISREHLLAAARDTTGLRAADAIHLAVALDVRSDLLLTYDQEMQNAAQQRALTVVAPV